jgi:hypothetical protein
MKKGTLLTFGFFIAIGGSLVSVNIFGKDITGTVKLKKDSLSHRPSFDYEQRQMSMRSHIFHKFPGTYLDSMDIVIHLLSDSIRKDLLKTKSKDSAAYLKTCLDNTLKDSLMLDKLSKLSMDDGEAKLNFNGILTARCMDASNSVAVDSVAMDVFSGSSLIASTIADGDGIIRLRNISSGKYSMVFSRRGYIPVSIIYAVGSNAEQSSLVIPLKKQSSYLVKMAGENMGLCLTAGIIFAFIYYLCFSVLPG